MVAAVSVEAIAIVALLVELDQEISAERQCAIAETQSTGVIAVTGLEAVLVSRVLAFVTLLAGPVDLGVATLPQGNPQTVRRAIDAVMTVEVQALVTLLATRCLDDGIAAEALLAQALRIAAVAISCVAVITLLTLVDAAISAGDDVQILACRRAIHASLAVAAAFVTELVLLHHAVTTEDTRRAGGVTVRTIRAV